jgi:hypothetical protein
MNTLLQSIFECNARAVDFLKDGRYQEAQAECGTALRQLAVGQDNENQRPQGPIDLLGLESIQIPIPCGKDRAEASVFPLFNRGIGVRPSSNTDMSSSVVFENKMTAVTLYNFALSFHLSGAYSGCSRRAGRALKLYRVSLALIFQDGALVDADEECAMLLVSMLNNLGHIYESLLIDSQEAANCFRLMECFAPEIASLDDSSFFYTTLVLFSDWPSPPAAAA